MNIEDDEHRDTEYKMGKFQDNTTDFIGVVKFAWLRT